MNITKGKRFPNYIDTKEEAMEEDRLNEIDARKPPISIETMNAYLEKYKGGRAKAHYPIVEDIKMWFELFPLLGKKKICSKCNQEFIFKTPFYYCKRNNIETCNTVGVEVQTGCSCGKKAACIVSIDEHQKQQLINILRVTGQI